MAGSSIMYYIDSIKWGVGGSRMVRGFDEAWAWIEEQQDLNFSRPMRIRNEDTVFYRRLDGAWEKNPGLELDDPPEGV